MLNAKLPGKSWLAAVSTAIVLGGYLLTADITNINDPNKNQAPPDSAPTSSTEPRIAEKSLPTVNARQFAHEQIPMTLTLYGRTRPDRIITVSSELAARIVGVKAERGSLIRKGETLISLREGNLRAELKSARAQVKKARLDLDSALALQKKKLIADNQLPQLELAVAEAESRLQSLQIDLNNTRIEAPVDGILHHRMVELGDFIDRGNPVAEILDLDPLIVSVDVTQEFIESLTSGDKAEIRLLGERSAVATVRYISRKANDATRTFNVELAIDNPDMKLPAGLSVEADLVMGQVRAVELSPALLSLNESGTPGIKWVDRNNIVQFTPAEIVKTGSNSLWLSGIPTNARIITRGQGFVKEGSPVAVVAASDANLVAGE
ncbi:efflux RND transporter periplasmic adaptor subunit [Endozoicomonas euniceicola]|uniref:Efflux RND transporter periplasmic adaptor subunit n=1 Tax=Endozoicomonas euniceicola TaxID=1234143 RepID=A0ABY6GSW2_9GAMM|nr:efflux RND transporter periplasmic adaptor subunit [Endozoicomonas euniceicola]UYM15845.1 efflux RND transporter periplasmic adaptor subunit [Endozoicomonas euniceicola]